MEPENIPQPLEQEDKFASLKKVTSLSRYLAMTLFVIMPFLGGWIGYTYAPEKVVEVEKIIHVQNGLEPNTDTEQSQLYKSETDYIVASSSWYQLENQYRVVDKSASNSVVISDLNVPFRETLPERVDSKSREKYVLEKLIESPDGNAIFFKSSIPYSSACCGIVKFDLKTLKFTDQGGYPPMYSTLPSPGNRYIPSIDAGEVSIVDIFTGTVVATEKVSGNETLASSYCGYAGDTYDLKWISDRILEYGVYDKASLEEDICEGTLIEKRRLTVE